MSYSSIEFVCAGNNGRSPVAEAAARHILALEGTSERIAVSSSGTMVDLSSVTDLRAFLEPHVGPAITRGLITPDARDLLATNPQSVLDTIIKSEAAWRNRYIRDAFGLDYRVHVPRQTCVYPDAHDAHLLLAVDEGVLAAVNTLYAGTEHRPTIELLPRFAGRDVRLDGTGIENYADYVQLAVTVAGCAHEAVARALR